MSTPRLTLTFCLAALLLVGPTHLSGQSAANRAVRAYHQANQKAILDELVGFLRLPNVASDLEAIRRNADVLTQMMERRGIATRQLSTPGAPYVFGELRAAGATTTVLFYAHYDGQPVDPGQWSGHDPYSPVLRDAALEAGGRIIPYAEQAAFDTDWRIYARSASDDKAPIVAALVALDALKAAGLQSQSNLKFLFEGDEEAGSPNLAWLAREHGELLAADLVVAADGPSDPSGRPTLYFGARGITSVEITVYGPLRSLHSGHYGNWAPNPAMRLAQLLASMKDPETGRVLVEGFYDDVVPLSDLEKAALADAPNDDEQQLHAFALAGSEMEGSRFTLINLPSLNVRGLRSGWVGDEARTIVPDRAIASLDLRLVKKIEPAEQVKKLAAHIERQGYHIVASEPDEELRRRHTKLARIVSSDGYPAFRTAMDLPVAQRLIEAIEANTGQRAVKLSTLGGSVPLYVFTDILGIATVGIPTVNHDNNQHSPNENLRLGNLWSGIEILSSAMLTH
jgi:acetylornithine deacetylase/succinyl-diaminopimelate desuccinylase-like protein